MRSITSLIAIAGVGALVFVAGRASVTDASGAAFGQPDTAQPASGDQGQPAMSEAEMAWMKAGQVGEHHKALARLVGRWEGAVTIRMAADAEPIESTGVATRELIMGGRFIKEEVDATFAGQPMHGVSYLGYDNITGEYQSMWIDDTGTGMYTETGWYDAAGKAFHFRGKHTDPATGRLVPTRSVMDMSDSRRHVMTGYAIGEDGREYVSFEGVFERARD